MKLEPPQPPTAPAPATRPTPPTPPHIDKAPFVKEKSVDSPEEMARDAVANGSGALTKRTVDRGDKENPPANQTVTTIPPDAPLVEDTQSDYDRGQDVLREFREMDAREARQSDSSFYKTETESQQAITPKINHNEGHGGAFWIFTIVFVAVAAFIVVKKFLFTDKPALTKSQLFDDDSTDKLKATTDKVKSAVTPLKSFAPKKDDDLSDKLKVTTDKVKSATSPPKPVRLPNKKEEDKPKHFEVRI